MRKGAQENAKKKKGKRGSGASRFGLSQLPWPGHWRELVAAPTGGRSSLSQALPAGGQVAANLTPNLSGGDKENAVLSMKNLVLQLDPLLSPFKNNPKKSTLKNETPSCLDTPKRGKCGLPGSITHPQPRRN